MLVQVKRHWFTEKTSIGLVIVDGVHFCFSLEDVARAAGGFVGSGALFVMVNWPAIKTGLQALIGGH